MRCKKVLHVGLFVLCTTEAKFPSFDNSAMDFITGISISSSSNSHEKLELVKRKADEYFPPQIFLQFDALNSRFILDLELHDDFMPEDAMIRYHWTNNSTMIDEPITGQAYIGKKLYIVAQPNNQDLETFINENNQTESVTVSEPFARFYVIKRGTNDNDTFIQGSFVYEEKFFQIGQIDHPTHSTKFTSLLQKSTQANDVKRDNLIITIQDAKETATFGETKLANNQTTKYKCGHDHLLFNTNPRGASGYFAQLLGKNDSVNRLVERAERGCPTTKKVLYLGIVADCSYVKAFNGDKGKAQANIINDFNIVSGIYEKYFNIILGIISIDLYPECSTSQSTAPWNTPCSVSKSLETRLGQFSAWRDTQNSAAGLYHLVSGCVDSDVVGIAWLNQVCRVNSFKTSSKDIVSGTSISVLIPNQKTVILHEISHNFGAVHDCDGQACSACNGDDCKCCPCEKCDCLGQYVMNPESGGLNINEFSPCSRSDICEKMPILASCLKPPGSKKIITGAVCGNGIKEEGEECDCGTPAQCKKNNCCTKDCKLKPNAQCSDENDQCCSECSFIPKSANKTCRKAQGLCQLDTICSGKNGECPLSENIPNGHECEFEDGKCASGICTSRDRQCAAVGSRLGISKACPSQPNSCSIVCQMAGSCVFLDAKFIDGTSCGEKGYCNNGVCSESEVRGFFLRNTALVISLLVFIVILMVALTIRFLVIRFRRGPRIILT